MTETRRIDFARVAAVLGASLFGILFWAFVGYQIYKAAHR
jgi:hypothetical protein